MRSKLALILNVVSVPLALAGFGLDVFLICSGRPGLTGTRCPAIGLLAWSGLCWANARSILQPDIEGSVSRRLASVATTLFVAGISVGKRLCGDSSSH